MTATATRRARYSSIVDGSTTPVATMRDARGPKTITAHEHDERAARARARFENAVGASRSYAEAQMASTLAAVRASMPGYGK